MMFLDGVGIGRHDPAINPFFAARLPALRSMFDGQIPSLRRRQLTNTRASLLPLDATLGVKGLPQSGTGQTALFTGLNGPKHAGKHFGPHPYSTLRPIIEERNIFRQVLHTGRDVCFANAFPRRFFDYVNQKRSRLTVTTMSCLMSGVPLLGADDLEQARGISADITNAGWPALGYPSMKTIEPSEAGRRLVRLTEEYDFVLFEYWKTDHAGHSMNMNEAVEVLECFDAMLGGVLDSVDVNTTLIFITSDHGNIEDMTIKTHTRNPVPAIMYGHGQSAVASALLSHRRPDLTHVTPTLMRHAFQVPGL